ncbi:MAG: hypothetical protein U9P68_03625 [Pseudomonadota bacterium]|nr:hypothetical protein [Pseudomonadota bacterium]
MAGRDTAYRGDALPGQTATCPVTVHHEVWSAYCDFQTLADVQMMNVRRQNGIIEARNIFFFGTAVYAASTLALNANGLTEAQTTDLLEAGLGAAIVQSADVVYNPVERRTIHSRAVVAADCARAHTDALLRRETGLENLVVQLGILETRRGNLAVVREVLADSDQDTGTGELTQALEAAQNAEGTATQVATRANDQIDTYRGIAPRLYDLRRRILWDVDRQLLSQPVNYAEAIAQIRAAAQTNSRFDQENVPPAPEEEDPDKSVGAWRFEAESDPLTALREATSALNAQSGRVQSITPGIETLADSAETCATILATGEPVDLPDISSAGMGAHPLPTDTVASLNASD